MEESSYNNSSSSSSTIRFLGILKQPATTNNNNHTSDSSDLPFELDESDVIWSSSASSSPDLPNQSITTATDFIITESNSSPTLSSPSTLSNSSPRNSFRSDKFGLSAAISDDNYHHNNHLQRKRSLNSPLSAASTAVRMIPPIPIQRSNGGGVGSGGGGGSGSGGGGGSFLGSSSLGKYPYNQSAPVNVPVWPNRNHRSGSGGKKVYYEDDDDDDDDGSYAEMLPPHEIVARSHLTTFSVFEGVGRTLKGRDLRRVRNAVMQKTGFLD